MTDLTEMWTELERYQPYADRRGFGEAWKQMCEERTDDAADAACGAAKNVAESTAGDAAWAAAYAAATAAAILRAQLAIKNIRDAIAQEDKT